MKQEEPVEELTDILVKPTPRARKGRSDRGGTRGGYIDKALATAAAANSSKTVEKAHAREGDMHAARATIVPAPRYNIVIV